MRVITEHRLRGEHPNGASIEHNVTAANVLQVGDRLAYFMHPRTVWHVIPPRPPAPTTTEGVTP